MADVAKEEALDLGQRGTDGRGFGADGGDGRRGILVSIAEIAERLSICEDARRNVQLNAQRWRQSSFPLGPFAGTPALALLTTTEIAVIGSTMIGFLREED